MHMKHPGCVRSLNQDLKGSIEIGALSTSQVLTPNNTAKHQQYKQVERWAKALTQHFDTDPAHSR